MQSLVKCKVHILKGYFLFKLCRESGHQLLLNQGEMLMIPNIKTIDQNRCIQVARSRFNDYSNDLLAKTLGYNTIRTYYKETYQ